MRYDGFWVMIEMLKGKLRPCPHGCGMWVDERLMDVHLELEHGKAKK